MASTMQAAPLWLALVTSGQRLLLLEHDGSVGLPSAAKLPAAVRLARTHLDGEVSGLRTVRPGTVPPGLPGLPLRTDGGPRVVSGRLVGHASGRWLWRPPAGGDAATVREVAVGDVETLAAVTPETVAGVLVAVATSGQPMALLLGGRAADV